MNEPRTVPCDDGAVVTLVGHTVVDPCVCDGATPTVTIVLQLDQALVDHFVAQRRGRAAVA